MRCARRSPLEDEFSRAVQQRLRAKLGLRDARGGDAQLIDELLKLTSPRGRTTITMRAVRLDSAASARMRLCAICSSIGRPRCLGRSIPRAPGPEQVTTPGASRMRQVNRSSSCATIWPRMPSAPPVQATSADTSPLQALDPYDEQPEHEASATSRRTGRSPRVSVLPAIAGARRRPAAGPDDDTTTTIRATVHDDDEWRKQLQPMQYLVGARPRPMAFTGKHWTIGPTAPTGVGCGQVLFDSSAKFDAGCGWPSWWKEIDPSRIERLLDNSHGVARVEARCANCGSHLGHVFDDGPEPSGERYCINSAAIDFAPKA
jgi:peptide-methionine (R)-S-oxide reductase